MVKYKLIIEYYQKGNNNSQIATLCGCSRTVVWEVLNRFNKIETIFADIQRMSEEELRILLFPERVKKDKGYLIPDFKWEEFQMRKHQSSLRLCWRRYCKRAAKQNLKAYSWASFGLFYSRHAKHCGLERKRGTQEQDERHSQKLAVHVYFQIKRARHERRFGRLQGGRQLQRRRAENDNIGGYGTGVLCRFYGTSYLRENHDGRIYQEPV